MTNPNDVDFDDLFPTPPWWVPLHHIEAECCRQDDRFPDQHLPNGAPENDREVFFRNTMRDNAKAATQAAVADGTLTWALLVNEECHEVLAEADPVALRAELVQLAALAVRWIEDLDRTVT